MELSLTIRRLKVYAYHGVLPQEEKVGANFYLTIRAKVEADDTATKGDDLQGTVSYADIVEVAEEEMKQRSRRLENVVYSTQAAGRLPPHAGGKRGAGEREPATEGSGRACGGGAYPGEIDISAFKHILRN